ncbi:hypothetical protein Tco_0260202 [Tanacetum coccineum]
MSWMVPGASHREIAPTTLEGVNRNISDLSTTFDQETTIMHGLMEDARDDRSELRGRVNLLYRDRPIHHHLAVMVEREAWMAREAWGFSMDVSDDTCSHVLALRLPKDTASIDFWITGCRPPENTDPRSPAHAKKPDGTQKEAGIVPRFWLFVSNAMQPVNNLRKWHPYEGPQEPQVKAITHNIPTITTTPPTVTDPTTLPLRSLIAQLQAMINEASQVKLHLALCKDDALHGGYAHVQTTTPEAAHAMPWANIRSKQIPNKYQTARGPRSRKTEAEIMFPEESDQIEERYYGGFLPDRILGSVKALKSKTKQEVIEFTNACKGGQNQGLYDITTGIVRNLKEEQQQSRCNRMEAEP